MMQALTTTFTSTFPVEKIDISLVHSINFTIAQGTTKIVKEGNDIEVNGQTLSTTLSQEESLRITQGRVKVQWNWLFEDGARGGSKQKIFEVEDNLYKEVMV